MLFILFCILYVTYQIGNIRDEKRREEYRRDYQRRKEEEIRRKEKLKEEENERIRKENERLEAVKEKMRAERAKKEKQLDCEFDYEKVYKELKNKKNLNIDEMGLLYKAASIKKQKIEKELIEKKQLMLDRAGVQLTIDDWTKQQAKDKERQDAINAIMNKDGQLSFFNEITEEQIQKQIRDKRRQERELFRKKIEEDRQRHEQWMTDMNEWAKEMNKKFEERGLETRLSLFK